MAGAVYADVEPAALVSADQQLPVTPEAQLAVTPQGTELVTTNTALDLDKAQGDAVVELTESTQPQDVASEGDIILAVEEQPESVVYQQVALSESAAPEDYAASDVQVHPTSAEPRAAAAPFGGVKIGNSANEQKPLPYALVLALIALIGLVPVSRRYH